jgi:ankyrin repeat protein
MLRFALASLAAVTVLIVGCDEPRNPGSSTPGKTVSSFKESSSTPRVDETRRVAAGNPENDLSQNLALTDGEEEEYLTIHALCESGDATPDRIQAFLDLGNNVNATREMDLVALDLTKDENGDGEPDDLRGAMTPLQLAAMYCKHEAVEFLIKAGGDSSLGAYGNRSPLQLAALRNDDSRVTALLIRAGSDVNAKNWSGSTPLHVTASHSHNPKIATLLIKAGADVNAKNEDGFTPLHLAGGGNNENPEIITTLIKAGADVNAKSEDGFTPLHLAGGGNNENPEIITTLIKAGADVNAKSESGATPLHSASHYNDNPEVATTLIKAGADLNARDKKQMTPIHSAIYNDNPAILTLLIKAGSKISVEKGFESRGEIPPIAFALLPQANPEALKILLDAGASVDFKDPDGYTLMHGICNIPDLTTDRASMTIEALIKAGADINAETRDGQTPLHYAAADDTDPGMLTILIKAGAEVNAKAENDGRTPLHVAAKYNENPEVVATLIKAGAEVNAKAENDGRTPLHVAAKYNENREVVATLIKAGADVNAKDDESETPLDLCGVGRNLRPKIAEVLRAAGGKRGKDLAADLPSLAITVPASAWKEGKPIAIQGLDIRTRRPMIPITSWLSYRPKHHPVARLAFDRAGKPTRVSLLVRSQEPDLDDRLIDMLYRWRAKGDVLANLAGDQTVTIEVKLLLN